LATVVRPVRAGVVTAALLALCLTPSAIRDWKLNRLLARRDTRTIAREWIEQNVLRPAKIAATDHLTPYGKPQLPPGYTLVEMDDVASLRANGVRFVISDESPLRFYSRGPTPAQLRDL